MRNTHNKITQLALNKNQKKNKVNTVNMETKKTQKTKKTKTNKKNKKNMTNNENKENKNKKHEITVPCKPVLLYSFAPSHGGTLRTGVTASSF